MTAFARNSSFFKPCLVLGFTEKGSILWINPLDSKISRSQHMNPAIELKSDLHTGDEDFFTLFFKKEKAFNEAIKLPYKQKDMRWNIRISDLNKSKPNLLVSSLLAILITSKTHGYL